jgi:RNase P/RNase MRP subunit p29
LALTSSPVVRTSGSVSGVSVIRLRRIGIMGRLTDSTAELLDTLDLRLTALTFSKALILTRFGVRGQALTLTGVELINGLLKRRLTGGAVSLDQ